MAVREELSVAIAHRLRTDELDLGLVSEIPEPARHGLELQQIASEPLVIALPPGHRLAANADIDFPALGSESFILFPEGATIRSTFDRLAGQHGIDPHIAFVTTDTDRMRELVGLGLGISLLPESDANPPGQEHTSVRIRGEALTYRVYLARRSSRRQSPAAHAMIALLETTFGSASAVARPSVSQPASDEAGRGPRREGACSRKASRSAHRRYAGAAALRRARDRYRCSRRRMAQSWRRSVRRR